MEQYLKTFQDCLNFLNYYGNTENPEFGTDKFWEELLHSAQVVSKRNGESYIVQQLLIAALDEIEKESKGQDGIKSVQIIFKALVAEAEMSQTGQAMAQKAQVRACGKIDDAA